MFFAIPRMIGTLGATLLLAGLLNACGGASGPQQMNIKLDWRSTDDPADLSSAPIAAFNRAKVALGTFADLRADMKPLHRIPSDQWHVKMPRDPCLKTRDLGRFAGQADAGNGKVLFCAEIIEGQEHLGDDIGQDRFNAPGNLGPSPRNRAGRQQRACLRHRDPREIRQVFRHIGGTDKDIARELWHPVGHDDERGKCFPYVHDRDGLPGSIRRRARRRRKPFENITDRDGRDRDRRGLDPAFFQELQARLNNVLFHGGREDRHPFVLAFRVKDAAIDMDRLPGEREILVGLHGERLAKVGSGHARHINIPDKSSLAADRGQDRA